MLKDNFDQKIFDYFSKNYDITLSQDQMQLIRNLYHAYWADDLKNRESETLCFWFGCLVSELEKRNLLPQKITDEE